MFLKFGKQFIDIIAFCLQFGITESQYYFRRNTFFLWLFLNNRDIDMDDFLDTYLARQTLLEDLHEEVVDAFLLVLFDIFDEMPLELHITAYECQNQIVENESGFIQLKCQIDSYNFFLMNSTLFCDMCSSSRNNSFN